MTLNRAQRVIVRIGGCVLLIKLLFPPWIPKTGYRHSIGNYLIFIPPDGPYKIDTSLLFFQVLAIVALTAFLVWWCHCRQAITQSPLGKTRERAVLQRSWEAQQRLLPVWQRLSSFLMLATKEETQRPIFPWEGRRSLLRLLLVVALYLGLLVLLMSGKP